MIQINNLVKKFDDFTALDGVNMNVEKGAVYGLARGPRAPHEAVHGARLPVFWPSCI